MHPSVTADKYSLMYSFSKYLPSAYSMLSFVQGTLTILMKKQVKIGALM